MRKAFVTLAAGVACVVCLLLPRIAWAAASTAVTPTTVGATTLDGTRLWPIQRELAAGTHTIEASFDGLPGLLTSHAADQMVIATARLTVQIDVPQSAVEKYPSASARLTDAAGAPVANARIIFYVDGVAEGEARTDSAGKASRRILRTLAPGKHTVVAASVERPDLMPARASIELDIAATRLTLRFDPTRSQGGLRAPIVAHLTNTAGAPVAHARVVFLVGGKQDGEAFTGADGTAFWRIRRALPVGTHTVEGVFDGRPRLLAARASTIVVVAPTTIELRTVLASSRVGQPAILIARLTDAAGAPAKNARIALFVNGLRHGEIRTDANGIASRRLGGDLSTGTYTVEGVFEGIPGLLPTRTSMPLVVEPAVVEVQTVPALSGVRFALDNRTFVSNDDGIARIEVDHVGEYKLEALPWDDDRSGVRAKFDRWADPIFVSTRTIMVPGRLRLTAGFNVSYLVSQEFVDPAGHPIDPKRISSFALTSSYGTQYFFEDVQPRWLQGIHVVRLKEGLAESPVTYALDSVMIDGSDVVNHAQQRFTAHPGEQWQLQLQLYSARFVARDALFGFPIGSAIHLTYPNGQSRTLPLGQGGDVWIEALARGAYTVRIDAPGLAGPTPAVLSHDQEIVLLVLSYLDIAVVGLFLMALAFGLLFVGQPWLRMIARNPLAPLRRGTDGRRPVLIWLRDIPTSLRDGVASRRAAIKYALVRAWARSVLEASASAPDEPAIAAEQQALPGVIPPNQAASPPSAAAPAASAGRRRARLPRWLLDPALIFACLLIALGGVGGVLARSATANTPAIAVQEVRQSDAAISNRAVKKPVGALPVAPTAATTIAPPASPTAAPRVAPTIAPAAAASASRTILTFSQNLMLKSNGPDVVRLQQRLRELGYFDYPENTGYFGADTARAVGRFQAQLGLTPIEIVDRETVAALNHCGADCVYLLKKLG